MNVRFSLIACAAALLTLGACKDAPKTDTPKKDSTVATSAGDPTTLDSKTGRYALKIPAEFGQKQDQQVPIQTAVGQVMMNMTLAQTADGNNAVMVAYCDYPEAVFKQIKGDKMTAINAMFDSARAGGLRNMQGSRLISENKMELNGMPGRSIQFAGLANGKPVHARFDYYIDMPRLYQVGYITTDSTTISTEPIRQMFASLQVLPSPDAPAPDTTKK